MVLYRTFDYIHAYFNVICFIFSEKIYKMNLMALRSIILASSIFSLSACANLPYYAQAVSGHFEVMRRAQPIGTILANPDIDPNVKHALNKVVQIREFASRELGLPDNLSYTSYADLERPFVVWNVFAAPELSLKLKEWCFLQVGCVNYRGFFSQGQAEQYAEELRSEGYDVYVGGVRAYSTLGWFSDPVLNTFVSYSEMNLARLIFHELAHQVVFVPGDSMFNESFATTVEQEGIRRWFAHNGTTLQQTELSARQEREVVFANLIFKYRKQLQDLFQLDFSDDKKRIRKKQIFDDLHAEFINLKAERTEFESYDRWFAQHLNNALLATVSIYTQLVPAFQSILLQNDRDMEKFFNAVTKISKLPKDERNRTLHRVVEGYSYLEATE